MNCVKRIWLNLEKQLFSLLVVADEGNNAKNDKLISDAKFFSNSFSYFENSYIIELKLDGLFQN